MDPARQLERLFANADKPVAIPSLAPKYKVQPPPEFVPNVKGSCSGADSSAFHIYRKIRRKEYMRQQMLEEEAKSAEIQTEFQQKMEAQRRAEEERTAKKRAKRQKKKQQLVHNKKVKLEGEAAGQEVDGQEEGEKEKQEANEECLEHAKTEEKQVFKESPVQAEPSEGTEPTITTSSAAAMKRVRNLIIVEDEE